MSSVAVFVFLLDNIAGLNIVLNETLANTNLNSSTHECDRATTNAVLSAVSQELDLRVIPLFKTQDKPKPWNTDQDFSGNFDSNNLDNSILDEAAEETKEASINDYKFTGNYINHKDFYDSYNLNRRVEKDSVLFPENAPFLVAIFESLGNVTAETCAGTLVDRHWVLTAANCINILSGIMVNSTNATQSNYTVIAGASNPLVDGTAHNVTQIVYPNTNKSELVALMRVEPPINGEAVEIIRDEVEWGSVMVYGWILSKNSSGSDVMKEEKISAQIMGGVDCHALYRYTNKNVICLINKDVDKNVTQVSTGGPVLIVHNKQVKLQAVSQLDEHVFIAYPLSKHYAWICNTINNKNLLPSLI